MKKLFLLLLLPSLLFIACSSDDDDNDSDSKKEIIVESQAVSYNTIKLTWNKVAEAYRYQVFYKAEGTSEWKTSNSLMPVDNGTIVVFEQPYFSPDTKYTIVVKAFRDSYENSVIAESKEFTVTTLKPYAESIVGTWDLTSTKTVVTSNNTETVKAVENKIKEDVIFSQSLTFSENGIATNSSNNKENPYSVNGNTLILESTDGDQTYTSSSKISISDNILILYLDYTSDYKGDYPDMDKVIIEASYKRK